MKNKIIVTLVLSLLLLFVGYSAASGDDSTNNFIEKVAEIEIWAKTFIGMEVNGEVIKSVLSMDNGTVISEQELEFYLNESFLESGITNSEGYVEVFFGDYDLSGGSYSFKSIFQGNRTLFFNASFTESQIEIFNQSGIREVRIVEQEEVWENITELNKTEEVVESYLSVETDKQNYIQNGTVYISGMLVIDGENANKEVILEIEFNETQIFTAKITAVNGSYNYSLIADFENEGLYSVNVFLGNLSSETDFYLVFNDSLNVDDIICEEFEDSILFSSGYSSHPQGSVNYEAWYPENNCTEIDVSECFLQDITTIVRFMDLSTIETNEGVEGFVQISELDESVCNNPEQGHYKRYLAHEILGKEKIKLGEYCSENPDAKCDEEFIGDYENAFCYGVKTYASQYSIVDVVEIKYKLCWENG